MFKKLIISFFLAQSILLLGGSALLLAHPSEDGFRFTSFNTIDFNDVNFVIGQKAEGATFKPVSSPEQKENRTQETIAEYEEEDKFSAYRIKSKRGSSFAFVNFMYFQRNVCQANTPLLVATHPHHFSSQIQRILIQVFRI